MTGYSKIIVAGDCFLRENDICEAFNGEYFAKHELGCCDWVECEKIEIIDDSEKYKNLSTGVELEGSCIPDFMRFHFVIESEQILYKECTEEFYVSDEEFYNEDGECYYMTSNNEKIRFENEKIIFV